MNKQSNKEELLEIIYNYRKAQLLYVAAKLEISSYLTNGPKSSLEISQKTKTDPDAIYRVLRALASFGVYEELEDKQFALTEKGQLLLKDQKDNVWIDAVMRMEEYNWRPWGELLKGVKSGESVFEAIFGKNLFEYLKDNPDASQTFNTAMGFYTQANNIAILEEYDFTQYKTIADIGGNSGDFLRQILLRNESAKGVLFDLPSVIQSIDKSLIDSEMEKRFTFVEGSFFETLPEGCDLYVMKKIIHDWDDEHSLKILKKCYEACPSGGKVLLVESVVEKKADNYSANVINDIHMFVQTIGGRERTKDEYFDLLSRAGFAPSGAGLWHTEGTRQG